MTLIDAHCHLANLAEKHDITPMMMEAAKKGIRCFVSSALRRSEIQWHLHNPIPAALMTLVENTPTLIWSAGIHPNFDECDITMNDLELLAHNKRIHAIGECGLDRGNPDLQTQIDQFERQLSLAENYELPVIIHLVGHLHIAVPLLKRYQLKYLVHAYAGSLEGLKQLMDLDSYFTIGSRICKPDKGNLLATIITSGKYLFETDVTQYYIWECETNPLMRLIDLVDQVIDLTGIQRDKMIGQQWQNYGMLFGGNNA